MTGPGQTSAAMRSGDTGTDATQGAAPRRVLGSFDAYADAETLVDTLADRRFPVERVTIVARDLRFVEHVTGRLTTARAAARSALSGLAFGAFLGLILGFFAWRDPIVSGLILAIYGAVLGALIGAIVGAVGHGSTKGRRDFSSTAGMQAGMYDVMVDDGLWAEARRILDADPRPSM